MNIRKEITLALIVKIVLLYVVWNTWFDHAMTDGQAASGVERVILNR
ncbi:hypothetical protein GALL_444870 [mine drainage metagenome]|jgi:hypothetical protein|uniref:Uncharacterized protein n=1 Tax=mine drainage metagenome TaxID=410659 RepID=A0A1J5PQU0_9ZZZZ